MFIFYTVSISIQEFSFLLLLCESFANSTNDALVFIQGVKGNSAYYTHLLPIGVLFKLYASLCSLLKQRITVNQKFGKMYYILKTINNIRQRNFFATFNAWVH